MGGPQRVHGAHVPAAVQRDPHQPGRGAPQAVGVLRAGRGLIDRERPHQVVDLLGGRDQRAHLARRHRRVRPLGQVVLLHRGRDLVGDALAAGVLRGHVALQLGELGHEHRTLVGLRQAGGLRGGLAGRRVGADGVGQRRATPATSRSRFWAIVPSRLWNTIASEAGVEGLQAGLRSRSKLNSASWSRASSTSSLPRVITSAWSGSPLLTARNTGSRSPERSRSGK